MSVFHQIIIIRNGRRVSMNVGRHNIFLSFCQAIDERFVE